MMIDRHGQAKILTQQEVYQVLYEGLTISRDRAVSAICFFTGCRISEGRQSLFNSIFDQTHCVRPDIIIPWQHTKGKQGTRVIPTHPTLAKILEQYYEESCRLLQLKQLLGDWDYRTLDENGRLIVFNNLRCPKCGSNWIHKSGSYRGEQCYLCRNCQYWIRESLIQKNLPDLPLESTTAYDTFGVKSSHNYGFLFADPDNPYLFPGKQGKGCLSLRRAIDSIDQAFDRLGIIGASSHSWRRTSLTMMHLAGVPLRVIQEISGHKDLKSLQAYLEVTEDEIKNATCILE